MDQPRQDGFVTFKDFVLDPVRGTLTKSGTEIPLRPKAFVAFRYLLERPGTLVSREELTEAVWGHQHVTKSSLTQVLREIRHALGDQEQQLIHTVPRRGYRFELPDSKPDKDKSTDSSRPVFLKRVPIIAITVAVVVLGYVFFQREHGLATTTSPEQQVAIAVLPLLDLTPGEDLNYFADGLTEDLLNLLTAFEELKVSGRTSSFYYKNKLEEVPLAQIGRELEVTHVLEGSVRKNGDRIRVTAQLLEVENGYNLWSESYDRTLDDIFNVQDEIAAAVAQQLKAALLNDIPVTKTVDVESWDLTLQAQYLFNRRDAGDLEQALELFERAVEIDPDNAEAWIGLAPLTVWLFDPPRAHEVLLATEKAITLAPNSAEAWSRRSLALHIADDNQGAQKAWERALSLGENSTLIKSQLAGRLIDKGDIEGAVTAQQKAVALDRLHPINLGNLASYLLLAGQLAESREVAEKILTLSPENRLAITKLAEIALLESQPMRARALLEQTGREPLPAAESPQPVDWYDAMIEHALGNQEAADQALQRYLTDEAARPIWIACIYSWNGDIDAAFTWLDRALDQQPGLSLEYSFEPWLDPLEGDPRWSQLMARWNKAVSLQES